jgi:hypothetical protein
MRLSGIATSILGLLAVSSFLLLTDFASAVEFKYGGMTTSYQQQQADPPPKKSARSLAPSGSAHPPAATGHHK